MLSTIQHTKMNIDIKCYLQAVVRVKTYSDHKQEHTICNMATLTSTKKALREEIKNILKNISLEKRKEQSATVFTKVSVRKINKSIISRDLLKRLCSDEKVSYINQL